MVECAFEVGEGDGLAAVRGADAKAFDLVEDGRVGGIGGVVAVDLAGNDDAQGRRLGDHGADLDGRSVGAEEEAVAGGFGGLRGDLEGVLSVAGGMVFGEVEGFEVVEVGLDLRAERGGVAEVVEDFDDAVAGGDEGVRDAGGAEGAGEGNVEGLNELSRGGYFNSLFDLLFKLIEANAEGFAGLGRSLFEPCFGDELQSALFAAKPEEAEGFWVGIPGRGMDFFSQGGEGSVESGFVVGGQVGDGFVHGRVRISATPDRSNFKS